MPSETDGEIFADALLNIQDAITKASERLAGRVKNSVDSTLSIFDKAKDLIIDIKAQKPMWWNGDDANGIVGLSDEFDNKREELAVARSGGDLINAG